MQQNWIVRRDVPPPTDNFNAFVPAETECSKRKEENLILNKRKNNRCTLWLQRFVMLDLMKKEKPNHILWKKQQSYNADDLTALYTARQEQVLANVGQDTMVEINGHVKSGLEWLRKFNNDIKRGRWPRVAQRVPDIAANLATMGIVVPDNNRDIDRANSSSELQLYYMTQYKTQVAHFKRSVIEAVPLSTLPQPSVNTGTKFQNYYNAKDATLISELIAPQDLYTLYDGVSMLIANRTDHAAEGWQMRDIPELTHFLLNGVHVIRTFLQIVAGELQYQKIHTVFRIRDATGNVYNSSTMNPSAWVPPPEKKRLFPSLLDTRRDEILETGAYKSMTGWPLAKKMALEWVFILISLMTRSNDFCQQSLPCGEALTLFIGSLQKQGHFKHYKNLRVFALNEV